MKPKDTSQFKIIHIGRWVFMLGIFIAIPYWFYAEKFSGQPMMTIPIGSGEGRWAPVAGVKLSKGSTEFKKQLEPLYLGPEMNPLRLTLKVERVGATLFFTTPGPDFSYEFAIADSDGQAVWQDRGSTYSSSSNDNSSISIFKVESFAMKEVTIPRPTQYIIYSDIDDNNQQQFKLKAYLEVRRNVVPVNVWVLAFGGLVSLAGLIILIKNRKLARQELQMMMKKERAQRKKKKKS